MIYHLWFCVHCYFLSDIPLLYILPPIFHQRFADFSYTFTSVADFYLSTDFPFVFCWFLWCICFKTLAAVTYKLCFWWCCLFLLLVSILAICWFLYDFTHFSYFNFLDNFASIFCCFGILFFRCLYLQTFTGFDAKLCHLFCCFFFPVYFLLSVRCSIMCFPAVTSFLTGFVFMVICFVVYFILYLCFKTFTGFASDSDVFYFLFFIYIFLFTALWYYYFILVFSIFFVNLWFPVFYFVIYFFSCCFFKALVYVAYIYAKIFCCLCCFFLIIYFTFSDHCF